MCRFKLFTIVAAALMMVACSTEDITQQPKTGEMQFTATLAAPNKGGTRTAYTVDGTDIKVAWKVGDEIALVHKYVKDVATVKSVDATTGQATISGIITGTPADGGEDVKLIYPAAYISGVDNDRNPTMNKEYYNQLFAQDGTLDYIQNNIDFREGEGQLSVTETGVTLKSTVIMESSIAIWKLTLQNDAATPAALAATKVTIKGKFTSEGQDEDLASTTELSPGASTVYLAVPVMSDTYASLSIMALVDDDIYTYTKENVTLAPGKYYQSTVNLSKTIVLSTVTTATTIEDGLTVTGTLKENVKISIAAGATVTLDGVSINADGTWNRDNWAGLTCEGDATIILKDGTENTVKGFSAEYPGIYVPSGNTLTIKGEKEGTGSLNASSNGNGAGIGGGYGNSINCGNIVIEGGDITATGSSYAAGIGSASNTSCGDITISGGTITANGGEYAAGIGTGYNENAYCGDITISGGTVTATGGENGAGIGTGKSGSCNNITISGGTVSATGGEYAAGIGSGINSADCGNITITTGVTQVTATKGNEAPNSIGAGNRGFCGTVTIGCTLNSDGYPVGGTTGAITTSPYTYPAPAATGHALSAAVVGDVVGSDGQAYDGTDYNNLPTGVTAVAKVCYVSSGHGLALALADESSAMDWSTAITTAAAHTPTVTGGTWKLATKDEWTNMITAAGGYTALRNGFTSVGGSNLDSNYYWSNTEYDSSNAWTFLFSNGSWEGFFKSMNSILVRACLAF